MVGHFRKMVTVLLALEIIISSAGLSAYLHHCNCSGENDLSVFPLYSIAKADSCGSLNTNKTHSDESRSDISQTECCSNTYLYLKLPVFFDRIIFFHYLSDILSDGMVISDTKQYEKQPDFIISVYISPPAPRYGKMLVFFIHNLKIPLPFKS